jgi:hypothetical protein
MLFTQSLTLETTATVTMNQMTISAMPMQSAMIPNFRTLAEASWAPAGSPRYQELSTRP